MYREFTVSCIADKLIDENLEVLGDAINIKVDFDFLEREFFNMAGSYRKVIFIYNEQKDSFLMMDGYINQLDSELMFLTIGVRCRRGNSNEIKDKLNNCFRENIAVKAIKIEHDNILLELAQKNFIEEVPYFESANEGAISKKFVYSNEEFLKLSQ